MAGTLHLLVATPERQLVDEDVSRIELPGKKGYIGILPEHAPLLSELGAGVLSYGSEAHERFLAVDGGFVEVLENQVRVLAERAEFGTDIDLEQARRAVEDAQARVEKPEPQTDTEKTLAELRSAQARLEAAERTR
jgi:F-type H+-transporting ATPase subunit epsilon